MAFGDTSNPTRYLSGQTNDDRKLALEIFGGEVLTAFETSTLFADKVTTKTLGKGAKAVKFPKVWKAQAEYHRPGQELLGNKIDTSEVTVTVDDMLVAHTGISDIDDMLSSWDARSPFSRELGIALAGHFDKTCAQGLILAARGAADGPFPGGGAIADNALKANATGVYDGKKWIEAIRNANDILFDKDVPEHLPRFAAVPKQVFNAIKWAQDAQGRYLVQDRLLNDGENAGGMTRRVQRLDIDGVTVLPAKALPKTDLSADTSILSKYRADYAKTLGILWSPMALGVARLRDIMLENTRDTRRLEDFMVASMLTGSGTLRPECAVEFAFVS